MIIVGISGLVANVFNQIVENISVDISSVVVHNYRVGFSNTSVNVMFGIDPYNIASSDSRDR